MNCSQYDRLIQSHPEVRFILNVSLPFNSAQGEKIAVNIRLICALCFLILKCGTHHRTQDWLQKLEQTESLNQIQGRAGTSQALFFSGLMTAIGLYRGPVVVCCLLLLQWQERRKMAAWSFFSVSQSKGRELEDWWHVVPPTTDKFTLYVRFHENRTQKWAWRCYIDIHVLPVTELWPKRSYWMNS